MNRLSLLTFAIALIAYRGGWPADVNPLPYNPTTVEWITCDVGNLHNCITNSTVLLSGTNENTVIFGDDTQQYPSMVWTVPDIYPFNHYLYYGTLRLGYDNRLVHLSSDTSPGINVIEPPNSISDFDTYFYISDQSGLIPPNEKINVAVHQNTFAWSNTAADDFIIYDYRIVNLNNYSLNPFYVAFHADCDVSAAGGGSGPEGYWIDDLAGYYRNNSEREYISYMYDGDNPVIPGDDTGGRLIPRESAGYIGSRLLYCPPDENGNPERTQTGHHWWDWNNEPLSDYDWYVMLSDGLWLTDPPSPNDYKYLQKTGPFLIPSNDSIRIVFAFGIGEGVADLRDNLSVAQWLFDNGYTWTSVYDSEINAQSVFLLQNHPNPFNAQTTIEYELPEAGLVRIDIYDMLGRKIKTLVDEEKQAGQHQFVWDASRYSSGVYFYRIEAGNFTETRRMILLK